MSHLKALLALTSALSLTACGGMSDEEVSRGWQATQSILSAGTASQGQALTDADVDGDFDFECPGGGNARFEAQASVSEDAGLAEADFSYSVSFDGCVVEDVQIDGPISYASQSNVELTQANHVFVYVGDLSWSGAVEGDCAINMLGTAEAGVSELGLSAALDFDGSICGREADVALGFSL